MCRTLLREASVFLLFLVFRSKKDHPPQTKQRENPIHHEDNCRDVTAFVNTLTKSLICIFAGGRTAVTVSRNSTFDSQKPADRTMSRGTISSFDVVTPGSVKAGLWLRNLEGKYSNGLGLWEDPTWDYLKELLWRKYLLRRELGPSTGQHGASVESWKVSHEALLGGVLPKC